MTQSKGKETNGGSEARLSMDIKHIKNLIELMVANDLSRMELREGDSHILLRRGQPVVAAVVPPAPLAAPPSPAIEAPPADGAVAGDKEVLIRSPMVGTFYASSDPESPPFASVGSVINPNTVVCLIEAMKVFNEIKAEVSGQITKVLVKNAEAVEFDQPLFAVTPA
jgi:acetyl-CoA carboxylase biotin carboxyl carrier protein